MQIALNYAKALYELSIKEEEIADALEQLEKTPSLYEILSNPVVLIQEKERLIDRIFSDSVRNFLKVICRHQRLDQLKEILLAYRSYEEDQKRILHATISYAVPPSEEQLERMKKSLCKRYQSQGIMLEEREDPSLLGGFIIRVGNLEYDNSLKGRYKRLEQRWIGGENR